MGRASQHSITPILHHSGSGFFLMDTWTFGWTLALIGMGGTMLVLWIMSLLILLIRKIFPYQADESATKKG